MKKVLVAQVCLTLCDPMDCSLCPWNSPGKNTGVSSHSLLQGIFQGSNSDLPHCRWIIYHLSNREAHDNLSKCEFLFSVLNQISCAHYKV